MIQGEGNITYLIRVVEVPYGDDVLTNDLQALLQCVTRTTKDGAL